MEFSIEDSIFTIPQREQISIELKKESGFVEITQNDGANNEYRLNTVRIHITDLPLLIESLQAILKT